MKIQEKTSMYLEHGIVYMEVYGNNRIIYRVTASRAVSFGQSRPVYGVMLEDLRSGERQGIANFSDTLEETIRFANELIEQEVVPAKLYDAALQALYYTLRTANMDYDVSGGVSCNSFAR